MANEEQQRNQLVVLSNVLTQQARHQLSLGEQKAIYYIISLIKPTDTNLVYDFEISNYINVCGLEKGGKTYREVRKNLSSLSDKSWFLENEETGNWTQVRWLNKIQGNTNKGIINIKIDEDLKPYLIELGNRFTQFELINILALSSSYAIQLYLLFKSYEWKHKIVFSCDDFKKKLTLNQKSYNSWGAIKRAIIDPSIAQINEKTDLIVNYKDDSSQGKKATQIVFIINTKQTQDVIEIKNEVNKQLGTTSDINLFNFDTPTMPKRLTAKQKEMKTNALLKQYHLQLEYENLIDENTQTQIDELIDIMIDVELSNKQSYKINKDTKEKEFVLDMFHKLTSEHIEYVLICLKENTSTIKNIKNYLITTLYNAPLTMESWYQQRFNSNKNK